MTADTDAAAQAAAAPQVSIIVPVYNVEAYLRRCLNSILAQTMPDWECICVDDGSPDGCGAILDEYAARDARFVVIHKENGGVSSARNAGLDAARGEYIGFVDSDDWIESDTYELALSAARENDADLVQWGLFREWGGKTKAKVLPEGKFDVLSSPTCFRPSMWCKLVSRKLICHNNLRFPEGISSFEDGIFSAKCCLLAKCAFQIGRPLYHYVASPQSTTNNLTRERILESIEAIKMMEEFARKVLGGDAQEAPAFLDDAKIMIKIGLVLWRKPPDARLARKLFPKTGWRSARNTSRHPASSAICLLLIDLHLDFLLRLPFKAWGVIKMRGARRQALQCAE